MTLYLFAQSNWLIWSLCVFLLYAQIADSQNALGKAIVDSQNSLDKSIVDSQNALGQAIIKSQNDLGQSIIDAQNYITLQHNTIGEWLHDSLCAIFEKVEGTCSRAIGPIPEYQTFIPMVLEWPEGQLTLNEKIDQIHEALSSIGLPGDSDAQQGLIGYTRGGVQDELTEVKGKVDEVKGKVDKIEGKVDKMEGKVDTVQDELTEVKDELREVKSMMIKLMNMMGGE